MIDSRHWLLRTAHARSFAIRAMLYGKTRTVTHPKREPVQGVLL